MGFVTLFKLYGSDCTKAAIRRELSRTVHALRGLCAIALPSHAACTHHPIRSLHPALPLVPFWAAGQRDAQLLLYVGGDAVLEADGSGGLELFFVSHGADRNDAFGSCYPLRELRDRCAERSWRAE